MQRTKLNGIFNPAQNQQEELMKLNMYTEFKSGKSVEELFETREKLAKGIDPLNTTGTDLHDYYLSLMPGYSD